MRHVNLRHSLILSVPTYACINLQAPTKREAGHHSSDDVTGSISTEAGRTAAASSEARGTDGLKGSVALDTIDDSPISLTVRGDAPSTSEPSSVLEATSVVTNSPSLDKKREKQTWIAVAVVSALLFLCVPYVPALDALYHSLSLLNAAAAMSVWKRHTGHSLQATLSFN